MNCGNCGNPLEPGATFCSKCGATIAPLNDVVTQQPVQQVGGVVPEAPAAPKKKKKFPWLLILLLIFAGAGCYGGYYLRGVLKPCNCKNSEVVEKEKKVEDEEEEDSKKDSEKESKNDGNDSKEDSDKRYKIDASKVKVLDGEDELSKKVEVVKYLVVDSDYSEKLKVLLKNNSDEIIDGDVDVNYLDSQGIRINRDNGFTHYVKPGDYFVVTINVNMKEQFNSVTIVPKAEKKKSYYYGVDYTKEDFVEALTDSGIEVSYKNNTDKKVSADLSIIYYKDGEIVDFDESNVTSTEPGVTGKATFYGFAMNEYDMKKKFPADYCDKYEVIINYLYYYESDF